VPNSKKQLTLDQAARKVYAIVEEELSGLSEQERDNRWSAFSRHVSRLRR